MVARADDDHCTDTLSPSWATATDTTLTGAALCVAGDRGEVALGVAVGEGVDEVEAVAVQRVLAGGHQGGCAVGMGLLVEPHLQGPRVYAVGNRQVYLRGVGYAAGAVVSRYRAVRPVAVCAGAVGSEPGGNVAAQITASWLSVTLASPPAIAGIPPPTRSRRCCP